MGMNIDYKGDFTFADEASLEKALREASERLESDRDKEGGSYLEMDVFVRDGLTLRIDSDGSGPSAWGEPADSMLRVLAEHALEGCIECDDGYYVDKIRAVAQYRRRVVVQLDWDIPLEGRSLDDVYCELPNVLSEAHEAYEGGDHQMTINTTDPAGAIEELRPVLEKHGLLEEAYIAYRDPGSTEYNVVWPENYEGGFRAI